MGNRTGPGRTLDTRRSCRRSVPTTERRHGGMPNGGTARADVGHRVAVGSCLLCGGTGGPIRMREGAFVGRACGCGTIYIDPVPDPVAVPPTTDAHLASYYAMP